MITLRPYQTDCVNTVLNELMFKDEVLFVGATGCGKSEIMFELCDRLDGKVLIASHKVNLVEQTAKRATKQGKKVSIYCSSLNKKDISDITIASIQSINAIKGIHFDYLIIDEIHRLPNRNKDSAYKRLIDSLKTTNPNLKIIGCTATPYRVGGYIYGDKNSWFSKVSYNKGMKSLIEEGFLVKPRLKKTSNQFNLKGLRIIAGDYSNSDLEQLVDDAVLVKKQVTDALINLEDRKKVVWICTSIKHATMVQSMVPDSTLLHSKLHPALAEKNLRDFMQDRKKHMVSIMMLSEGFDHPPIDTIILMRPTRSPVLYVQFVGRGLRLSPSTGKVDCVIYDYGRVVESLGPVDNPTINIAGTGNKKKLISLGKFCEACLDFNDPKAKECAGCGTPFPVKNNPFTNMTEKHSGELDILSSPSSATINHWKEVTRTILAPKVAMSGRQMIEVQYYIKNKILPVREYLVFGEHWMNNKSLDKLSKFGIVARDYQEAVRKISSRTKKVTHIKTKPNGNFIEITEALYESI